MVFLSCFLFLFYRYTGGSRFSCKQFPPIDSCHPHTFINLKTIKGGWVGATHTQWLVNFEKSIYPGCEYKNIRYHLLGLSKFPVEDLALLNFDTSESWVWQQVLNNFLL